MVFKISATLLHQPNSTLTTARTMQLCTHFTGISFLRTLLAVRPKGQHIGYCTVYRITSIVQHESFLNKIVQKLWRASRRVFEHHKWQFSKKNSAIQLKSNKAIKLKNFNFLNVGAIPLVWLFHFFGIPIHCQNWSYSLKVHLRANCTKWHCQVCNVLSFCYISLLVLLKFDICLAGVLRNKDLEI